MQERNPQMIATEFKTPTATIRIHDEYFETASDDCISRLSQIVSESYKRRQAQVVSSEAAAAFRNLSKETQS